MEKTVPCMDNDRMLQVAMEQSAIDSGCCAEDFLKNENVIVYSKENPGARRYLTLPHVCNLISYGNNIVASIDEKYEEIVRDYIEKYSFVHCFETPNLHVFNDAFMEYGMQVCFMAEYFLPQREEIKKRSCGCELKVLTQEDFGSLYLPEWSNALCEKRRELDVLGVGACQGGRLVGLAGCSADCDTMWQIGVDVLPEYRRRGIASALTGALAAEIMARGKVPFYCCAWSNIRSARNAVRSGFRPAWVELTVKPRAFVEEMNRRQKLS